MASDIARAGVGLDNVDVKAATQAGVALGPGLMGLLHDVLGSYRPALWCLVALELVAAVSVLGGRPRHRDP